MLQGSGTQGGGGGYYNRGKGLWLRTNRLLTAAWLPGTAPVGAGVGWEVMWLHFNICHSSFYVA